MDGTSIPRPSPTPRKASTFWPLRMLLLLCALLEDSRNGPRGEVEGALRAVRGDHELHDQAGLGVAEGPGLRLRHVPTAGKHRVPTGNNVLRR